MAVNPINIHPELIERISAGECVAYVGAGFSVGAGLPLWKQLLEEMIGFCIDQGIELPEKDDLEQMIVEHKFLKVASIIIDRIGNDHFGDLMLRIFERPDLKPTEAHTLLTKIPFSSILTSNYDKLIESTYASGGDSVPVFTHSQTQGFAEFLASKKFHILKTHGTIDQIDSIVLSLNDYRRLMHANPAYQIYLQNIFTSKTVLFLGFSLTDPDLDSILNALQVYLKGVTPLHYALIEANAITQAEADQFRKNYNIQVIRYNKSSNLHLEVEEFLREIAKRTPTKFVRQLAELGKELQDFDSHYKILASSDQTFSVLEKYPGAAEEKPLQFSTTLAFDTSTEKGKSAFEAFQRHVETGEPITLTSDVIKDLKIPELFTKLTNVEPIDPVLQIGPSNSEPTKTKIVLQPSVGNNVVIENIELKKLFGGKKQATFTNENQNHVFKVKIILDFFDVDGPHAYKASISLTIEERDFNIQEQLLIDQFNIAVRSGAKLSFENQETGLLLLPPGFIQSDHTRETAPTWIPILQALLLIQKVTNVAFENPKSVSAAEARNILNTAYLIRNGKGNGVLKLSFTLELEVEQIRKMIADNGTVTFSRYSELTFVILEKPISLGLAWHTCNLSLSKDEKIRLQSENKDQPKHKRLIVNFSSNEKELVSTYCLAHLSYEDFESLHQDPEFRRYALHDLVSLLFDASIGEVVKIGLASLLRYFGDAVSQKNDYGKPLNMLPRCTANELNVEIKPYLGLFKNSEENLFFNELVHLEIINADDLVLMEKMQSNS